MNEDDYFFFLYLNVEIKSGTQTLACLFLISIKKYFEHLFCDFFFFIHLNQKNLYHKFRSLNVISLCNFGIIFYSMTNNNNNKTTTVN